MASCGVVYPSITLQYPPDRFGMERATFHAEARVLWARFSTTNRIDGVLTNLTKYIPAPSFGLNENKCVR